MKDLPVRKNIRLKGYDYSKAGSYYITICVKNRYEILGKIAGDAPLGVPVHGTALGVPVHDAAFVPYVELTEIGAMVKKHVERINVSNGKLDNYVIMPNHIHLLITINCCTSNGTGTPRGASPTKATILQIANALKTITPAVHIWKPGKMGGRM